LGVGTFDACSLTIQPSKFFCLLALASSLQGNIGFMPANGQGTLPGLGAERAHWTGSTGGIAKLDLDHFLMTRPGWRPTATDLPLRTTGLLMFPVDEKIG
jgi:hypothetical protein